MMAALHASTIEHRFTQRIPLRKDGVIYKNCIPIAVGETRDVSVEGMGINCEISNIRKYTVLQIELRIQKSAVREYHRLNGLVVHHGKQQFGILFTELNPAETDLLNRLMYSQ